MRTPEDLQQIKADEGSPFMRDREDAAQAQRVTPWTLQRGGA